MLVENRREVERFQNLLGFYLRQAVMQLDHNARHALLPKGHQHASAHYRLHTRRNGVSKYQVEGHGEGDVAEESHVA